MLTGKRFKLANPTLALDCTCSKRTAVTLRTGTIIEVLGSDRDEDNLIEVLSEDRVLAMFARDITMRGIEIQDAGRQSSQFDKSRRESR